jgi:hypothetical protein
MSVLVIALLGVAALAYVAAAFRDGRTTTDLSEREAELIRRKDAALAAIVDLEDERALGKLSAEDFEALVSHYETDAVEVLARLEQQASRDPLEDAIAAARERLRCPHCGRLQGTDATCPRCRD